MPKIIVVEDNEEVSHEIECTHYNIQYVSSDSDGKIQKITKLDNGKYGPKHWIKNYAYAPIARKIKRNLMEAVPELSCVNVSKLLFIEDIDYIGDEIDRNKDWVMRIKKAPSQLTEYTGYKFIIESREFWMSRISKEQIVAHIYSVMKQIDGDKVIEPDLKGWKEVIGTLGYGWETTLSPIQNLLDGFDTDDFRMLKKADRQISMFEHKRAEGE